MTTKAPTKAVIAAAGFGTRFLPQTKAMPKEMMPIVDKPVIQYLVEELVEAGIKDIILVTGYAKRSIEDHFDVPNQDLINNLRAGGPKKEHFIKEMEALSNLANFIYVRQKGRYGNAQPIMNVRHLIGDEPFIYSYADDLILAEPNRFKQMIALYQEFNGAILPCMLTKDDRDYLRYGIMGGSMVRDDVMHMDQIVEKPGRQAAPSNFASVGGYLFTPDIFKYVEAAEKELSDDQEFQIQTAMRAMMNDNKPYYACLLRDSIYCDTGDKLDYLKTVVRFALARDDIGADFKDYLRQQVCNHEK